LALGDVENAQTYLKKAITSTPYHHNANNSLGIIYEKQGRKNEAIQCYENSLRGSYTYRAINGLNRLDKEKALKLMDYIRHRYRQPDYLNFNKIIPPLQCLNVSETKARKKEHRDYQKMLDDLLEEYSNAKKLQLVLAKNEAKEIVKRQQQGKSVVRPFQPFAYQVILSVQKEFADKAQQLQKDLIAIGKERMALQIEYDTVMKLNMAQFEERSDKVGEGNGDASLEDDICEAKREVCNYYLPLFADLNEKEFHLIVYAYKDYLNDFLYWVRLATSGEQEYKVAYYDIVISMIQVLKSLKITSLSNYCNEGEMEGAYKEKLEVKEPKCPLPVGIEIPFVIGKLSFDCEGWGLEGGEAIVLNIDHKYSGETTIAIGPGESFYSTPKIFGHEELSLKPGYDEGVKGQIFFTFEEGELVDGGFLWEAEMDFKGIGKPVEIKQNFTWAVNKGFTYEGLLTDVGDAIFDLPPEKQVNKNVKIYH
ncbi:MAG: tetratricopeptide repeat protein, partial [Flavisolibacter sp.]